MQRQSQTTLAIIQGFLASGKSAFSRKLAEETNAVRFNADEWCERHCHEVERKENWNACFARAESVLWSQAEQALMEGRSVILDFGFWSKSSRDEARQRAERFGVGFAHYYLYAPDEVLLERLGRRQGPLAESNLKNFFELKKLFEEPCETEKAIFVNSFLETRKL
jgi:predicted kinase